MKRIATGALAACAAAVLGAGPALGLESLMGIYQGKLKCSGLVGGQRVKSKDDVEVQIFDLGGLLGIDVSGIGVLQGFATAEDQKPDRGKVSAVSCLLDAVSVQGSVLVTDVQVKPGGGKASVKGTLTRSDLAGPTVQVCSLKVSRISTAIPAITPCP